MKASRFLAVMLFVAGAVVVVDAQQPRQPGGGNQFRLDPATLVISNKALQEEIKVTDAQREKFKDVAEKQKKANEAGRGGFGKGGFDKEKLAERQKEREALNAEIKKVAEETLTADQKKRLKQIDRQALGMRAFTNEEVATELKLSDEQKSKIKGIVDEYNKDAAGLGGRGGFGNKGGNVDKEKLAENQAKREKLRKAAQADIDEVLTADQKKQWKDMTGEPFDTTKLFQFGGGRGPGGNNTKTKD